MFKLPVPEKAQKQFNYCLLPSSKHLLDPDSVMEPILWTVNAGPIKNYERGESVEDHDPEMIIDEVLRSVGLPVTEPAKKEFVSATPEAHRKTEKAYHVKAFKGSKDGKHSCVAVLPPILAAHAFQNRLSLLPPNWNLVWVQETVAVLLIRRDRVYLLHFGSTTDVQFNSFL